MNSENPYASRVIQDFASHAFSAPDSAKRATYWPGILMMTQGAILTCIFAFAMLEAVYERGVPRMMSPGNAHCLTFLLAPLLVMCGLKLKRIESRGMSLLGAILSVILFLPLGWIICIWTIVAVNRPAARDAFSARSLTRRS